MQIVIALDVPFSKVEQIVEQTLDLEEVRGYKFGFSSVLELGLEGKEGYYDHWGTGSDIPYTSNLFFNTISKFESIEGVVLSSLTGKESTKEWIRKAKQEGVDIIYLPPLPQLGYDVQHIVGELLALVSNEGVSKYVLDYGVHDNTMFTRLLLNSSLFSELNILHRSKEGIEGIDVVEAGEVIRDGFNKMKRLIKKIKKGGKEVVYDHQKAGMCYYEDISVFYEIAERYVDKVISFPLYSTQHAEKWIEGFKESEGKLIIGGEMTHPGFMKSEGGFFTQEYINSIYSLAYSEGIRDFVMPGNKAQRIHDLLSYIFSFTNNKNNNNTSSSQSTINIYSPGFISQGGKMQEVSKLLHSTFPSLKINFYPIVGRAVYEVEDVRGRVRELVRGL